MSAIIGIALVAEHLLQCPEMSKTISYLRCWSAYLHFPVSAGRSVFSQSSAFTRYLHLRTVLAIQAINETEDRYPFQLESGPLGTVPGTCRGGQKRPVADSIVGMTSFPCNARRCSCISGGRSRRDVCVYMCVFVCLCLSGD